jgi:hypothetical protein
VDAFLPDDALFLPLIVQNAVESGTVWGGNGRWSTPHAHSTPLDQSIFPFLHPISVTLTYIDAQIPGLDETTLILTYWDGSAWVDAATTCPDPFPYVRDPANNQITLQICHLTRFSMIGD